MRDRTPMIGLVAAALALVAVPAFKIFERTQRPMLSEAPPEHLEVVRALDAFWAASFEEQFPQARGSWRTPRVVFVDTSRNRRAAEDDYAGVYIPRLEEIRVDLESDVGYMAIVLAHEFGHHAQYLAGLGAASARQEALSGPTRIQRLGVRFELQAECLGGVWAHHEVRAGGVLTRRDIARHRALTDLSGFEGSHGTDEQRRRWFEIGFRNGSAADCDTTAPAWENL